MKKKAAALTALMLSAVFALSACGGSQTDEEETTMEQQSEVEEAVPEQQTGETEETSVSTEKLSEETAEPVEEEPATVEEEPATEEEQADILEFVDAHGEWHEVEILDAVEKHPFDLDCFSGSGPDLTYEDDTYTSRIGIDVSSHQGEIDWQAVRDAGVTFAFVRIGGRGYGEDGTLYADGMTMTNITQAQQAGLDVGVYFFSQAISEEEAVEEADYVLEQLDSAPLELPVVYDSETIVDEAARTDDVSGEQFTKNTLAFCDRIREAGYTPMVYCNMEWEAYELDLAALQEADIAIWYADYQDLPQTPYEFSIWQYTDDGHVGGIGPTVDLNIQIYKK